MVILTVKSAEARSRFRELLDLVMARKGDVMIERNGKEVAVMIPTGDYKKIKAELESMRAVREAAAVYNAKKDQAVIDPQKGTATIPLDLYSRLVVEREARFAVIDRIQENAPDLPEEEVEQIVAKAVRKVRAGHAVRGA
jgi:prevent-host-death family protein